MPSCAPVYKYGLLISTVLNHLVYSTVTPSLPTLSALSSYGVSSVSSDCSSHINMIAKHCHSKVKKIDFLDSMKSQCCKTMIMKQCLLDSHVANCSSPSSKMNKLSAFLTYNCPDYTNLNKCQQFLSAKTIYASSICVAIILLSFCLCKCRRTVSISNNNLPTSKSICELTDFKISPTIENLNDEISVEKNNDVKSEMKCTSC